MSSCGARCSTRYKRWATASQATQVSELFRSCSSCLRNTSGIDAAAALTGGRAAGAVPQRLGLCMCLFLQMTHRQSATCCMHFSTWRHYRLVCLCGCCGNTGNECAPAAIARTWQLGSASGSLTEGDASSKAPAMTDMPHPKPAGRPLDGRAAHVDLLCLSIVQVFTSSMQACCSREMPRQFCHQSCRSSMAQGIRGWTRSAFIWQRIRRGRKRWRRSGCRTCREPQTCGRSCCWCNDFQLSCVAGSLARGGRNRSRQCGRHICDAFSEWPGCCWRAGLCAGSCRRFSCCK